MILTNVFLLKRFRNFSTLDTLFLRCLAAKGCIRSSGHENVINLAKEVKASIQWPSIKHTASTFLPFTHFSFRFLCNFDTLKKVMNLISLYPGF